MINLRKSSTARNHKKKTIPTPIEITAINTPDFKYSTNDKFIPLLLADSATIKFATEPINVRLPAKVVAIAKINHAFVGSGQVGMTGLNNNTAGTFETKLLNIAEETDRFTTLSQINDSTFVKR
ncbi:MAG: hypothetical protein U5K00_23665 [Melioribacteraceae bacterium]|nr:hypothetical protein [Melioribacteraceae bacterium]